jgi:serine/threonine protein kinase
MNGQVLGDRYEVQQLLGKKTGRRTLLARDLLSGDLVVVKLLSFNNDFEWDDLKLFEREAETLKTLSHPSIPSYLDYFEVDLPTLKGFGLVQTYIPAQSLEKYIKAGRTFTENEVKQIAKALLDILIYLHDRKPPTVHRDIKPSNILLTNRSGNNVGQLYLVDFGSVQTAAIEEEGTRTVVGTYGYMPPEQFGGRTVPASDLYSLGATLIYLVTGSHPADLPQKDLRIQFEQAATLSPSFTNWLAWMTQPSLDKRFSSAPEAREALEKGELKVYNNDSSNRALACQISQPANSKIQLKKDENFLEILVPPVGFQPSMIFMSLFAISWNSFIVFWTITAFFLPFPINIPFVLFSLPFWGAGIQMMSSVLFPLWRHCRLKLNRFSICFTWEFLGFKYNRVPPTATRDITKIVYTPKTYTNDFQGNRIEIPPKLTLWAGVREYQFGGRKGLIHTESEIEWLAYELSTWLGLPLTCE